MNAVQRYTKALKEEPGLRIRRNKSIIANGHAEWIAPFKDKRFGIRNRQRLAYSTFRGLLIRGVITKIKATENVFSVLYGPSPVHMDVDATQPAPGQGSAGAGEGKV